MRYFLGTFLLTSLSLAFLGCRTTHPALFARDGRPIKLLDPIHQQIAIGKSVVSGAQTASYGVGEYRRKLGFALDAEDIQWRLRKVLNQLNTAEKVIVVEEPDLEQARKMGADLLIRPTLISVSMKEDGITGRFALCWLFWITTWAGGFFVEDYDYRVDLKMRFDILDVGDGHVVTTLKVKTDVIGLVFMERNNMESEGFFLSFILPPFWTTDHIPTTSLSLSHKALEVVGAKLAGYFKQDFPGPFQSEFEDYPE